MKTQDFYIARWVLCYLTRYPWSSRRQIVGASGYGAERVMHVLDSLIATGYVRQAGGRPPGKAARFTGGRYAAAEGWGWYIQR